MDGCGLRTAGLAGAYQESRRRLLSLGFLRSVYNGVPKPVKIAVDMVYGLIPNSLRYGRGYRRTLELLSRSQWWSLEQHEAYQLARMKELLTYSYEHVPYYRRVFDDCGFDPYSFSKIEEIEVLPLLNKDLVREHFEDLLSDCYPAHARMLATTGGTTGNQSRFYVENNYYQVELPFVESIWSRVGYHSGSRVAVLRNHSFEKGRLFAVDWKRRRLLIDNFHLTDSNMERILSKLAQSRIEFLHTYPSAAMSLSRHIKRSGYHMQHRLKAILVTSENIYPGQKEYIEDAFGCRPFTFYGHSERGCIAGWCEESDLYHVQSEYGYMELVDESNRVIREPGSLGEIVCTGFYNRAMPLIRYQTGDYTLYADATVCTCGRSYRLLNPVRGRWSQEMLICKDGSRVSTTALNTHSDVFRNVKCYQLYQDTVGRCAIRVVRTEAYTEQDEAIIMQEFAQKLGPNMDLEVHYVDDIERTPIGKSKYLVQKIPV